MNFLRLALFALFVTHAISSDDVCTIQDHFAISQHHEPVCKAVDATPSVFLPVNAPVYDEVTGKRCFEGATVALSTAPCNGKASQKYFYDFQHRLISTGGKKSLCVESTGKGARHGNCGGKDVQMWTYTTDHQLSPKSDRAKCLRSGPNGNVLLSACVSNDTSQKWGAAAPVKAATIPGWTPPTLSWKPAREADGSCKLFPDSNWWHADVSKVKVHASSAKIAAKVAASGNLSICSFGWPDGDTTNGEPALTVDTVTGRQPYLPITFFGYPGESDPPGGKGMYPFPHNAPTENTNLDCSVEDCGTRDGVMKRGSDMHVMVVDNGTCLLYETWKSIGPRFTGNGTWSVNNGAIWNLSSNAWPQRPIGWTSADAAGLPILVGLIRYKDVKKGVIKDVKKGVINHALRTSVPTALGTVFPASHWTPRGGLPTPWMGMRARLRSSFDCGKLRYGARVVCVAMQKYGLITADDGGPWGLYGEASYEWNEYWDDLLDLMRIPFSYIDVFDPGCPVMGDGVDSWSAKRCANLPVVQSFAVINGGVRSRLENFGMCLDTKGNKKIGAEVFVAKCGRPPSGSQSWTYNDHDQRLVASAGGLCLEASAKGVFMSTCKSSSGAHRWNWQAETGSLRPAGSPLMCLTVPTSTAAKLVLSGCDGTDRQAWQA
jgi:Ricin-type beta-trefoil lectin domain